MAREREIFDRYAAKLAELIALERHPKPDDLESNVIAKALVSLHRAMIEFVRRQVLAGRVNTRIARELEERGRPAIAQLKCGLEGVTRDRSAR